jgi:sugar lactone lactonase YvrE
MKANSLRVITLLAISILLLSGLATAQGPQPPLPSYPPQGLGLPAEARLGTPEFGKPFIRPGVPSIGIQSAGTASIPLGQPGLSFRYVQTFGVTEEPYLEDNNHFYGVEGLGVDGNNIWVTDAWGDRVVKFDSAGNFLQKIGKAGVIDYTGTSLDYVSDVAVDSSGNIWVVDGGAAHVVKYNSSGQKVSELGQSWNRGSANNQFNDPISIAFDSAGNIYISDTGLWGDDYGNHRVQVFDSTGNYLTTIGQTGVCGTANNQFCGPRHIAVYGNRLYVADAGNHRVQIFDITNPAAHSYVTTLGTTGVFGSDNSHFDHPEGVGVDASYIYVADSNNNRVQIFNRTTYAYVATLGTGFGQGNNQFNHPTDVVVDSTGNIYVADNWNRRVQQYNSNRVYQRTYGTTGVSYVTDGYHYYYPRGVAVAQDGSIYIVEERGHRLVKLNAAGVPQWTIGEPGQAGSDNSHFFGPQDVAVDSAGRVYTVESWNNHRVQIFNSNGTYYATLGTGWGTGNYQFKNPSGITIDRNGNIYVADSGNHRVQIYNSSGVYVATLGVTGASGSDNSHFNQPNDVAVDSNGTIYVADEGNDRVQVFNSNLQYVRTIGGGGTGSDFGHFDGWGPHHLAVDSQGRLYVVDSGNQRVQVFDNFANGNAYLTTIGGAWGTEPGRFSNVVGIAIGPDDSVYTSEIHNNHRIQKFAPGVPGWKQVNINGFGDRTNGNIHALASFGGQLYAGTYNSSTGAQLWRMSANGTWTQPISAGFGITRNIGFNHLVTFNNQLYIGVRNDADGASIYRSSDGTTWEPVVTGGFDSAQNTGVYRFEEFNGKLYAGTSSWTPGRGGEIWRSPSGDAGTWERVVAGGFDNPKNYIMRSSAVHNGYLYFGTQNVDTSSYMTTTGGIIIRSNTGDSGSWVKVTPDGLGDINNYAVSGLTSFGGYLYASTSRWDWSGVQVWRCQNCDGSDWEKVVDNGFDNPNNWGISALQVFNGELYLVVGNGMTGMEVWRTRTGNPGEWTKISDGGFGDSNNQSPYYNNVTVFNNRLYIGTQNGANGPEVWKKTVTADFTASPTVGSPGTTVTFTNLSGGDVVTSTWNFGDGSPSLTVTHTDPVTHTYTTPGVYTVTLTVEDGVDTDVRTRTAYIQIAHRIFLPLVLRAYNPLIALYDDFNNPAFDGFYNPLKWRFWGDENYFSARQQGGVLVITNTLSTPASVGLNLPLAMPMERTLRQVQRFQARMKLSSGTSGTGATIQIMHDFNGSGWWTQCSLNVYGSAPYFGCDITNYTPGNFQAEYGVSWPTPLNFDTWYTARIEIDPNTAQVCFYLDNNPLGCRIPSNANALKTYNDFIPRLVSWNGRAGATGTRYFDDIYITPAR